MEELSTESTSEVSTTSDQLARSAPPGINSDLAFPTRIGHHYQGVHVLADSVHLGDSYHHEPSPQERAISAVLESLEYPGMHDRRDAVAEAHEGTFDWTFLEGETQFVEMRNKWGDASFDKFQSVNMNFKSWLHDTDEELFCIIGKPGSGKSTFMYVWSISKKLSRTADRM